MMLNSQMAKRLIPSLNRVLVDQATKLNSGTVVAVRSGARDRDGDQIPVNVKEGHEVLLPDYGGTEVKVGDKKSYRYHVGSFSPSSLNFCLKTRGISSQAGAENGGEEDDLEDALSELGNIIDEEKVEESSEEELSDPELSDNEGSHDKLTEVSLNELDLSDTDQDANKESSSKYNLPAICNVIMSANRDSVTADLEKWDQEGHSITESDIYLTMYNLCKRRLYMKALKFSKWLEATEKLEFSERDYASRLDCIAKVHGLFKAEKYITDIPESYRGEVVYRTLLVNAVITANVKKAEAVFNKMRDLGFSMTAFSCNQLLLLYKRLDRKKLADVLLFMEKENILPTLSTYGILIDAKGQSNDIVGMEKLLDSMKEQGLEPDHTIQATLAKHYIRGGENEKAQAVLKEMEGDDLTGTPSLYRALLLLFAELGKVDEVGRIWEKCRSRTKPLTSEYMAAIEAWGKLGNIEEAEAVFEKVGKTWKLSSRAYTALLKVYAHHGLVVKGEELVKQMTESGTWIGPWTWDALIKLYVKVGELEKADSILEKAAQQKQTKAPFSTYTLLLEQYAQRGDVHNAEKIFHNFKEVGYEGRFRHYHCLLDAYINAKTPVYGFRERMKGDGLVPNNYFQWKLTQVDLFKKKATTDLLDVLSF